MTPKTSIPALIYMSIRLRSPGLDRTRAKTPTPRVSSSAVKSLLCYDMKTVAARVRWQRGFDEARADREMQLDADGRASLDYIDRYDAGS